MPGLLKSADRLPAHQAGRPITEHPALAPLPQYQLPLKRVPIVVPGYGVVQHIITICEVVQFCDQFFDFFYFVIHNLRIGAKASDSVILPTVSKLITT